MAAACRSRLKPSINPDWLECIFLPAVARLQLRLLIGAPKLQHGIAKEDTAARASDWTVNCETGNDVPFAWQRILADAHALWCVVARYRAAPRIADRDVALAVNPDFAVIVYTGCKPHLGTANVSIADPFRQCYSDAVLTEAKTL